MDLFLSPFTPELNKNIIKELTNSYFIEKKYYE